MSSNQTPLSLRLTNDDFRKLLMTPRPAPANPPTPGSSQEATANSSSMPPPKAVITEIRRKKKSYYTKPKKQENNKIAKLTQKFRDRASERGKWVLNAGYQSNDPVAIAQAYRAAAPKQKKQENNKMAELTQKYRDGASERGEWVLNAGYQSDDPVATAQSYRTPAPKPKKQENNKMAELTQKYRDRASESHRGINPDYNSDDFVATAQAYRAVAPKPKKQENNKMAELTQKYRDRANERRQGILNPDYQSDDPMATAQAYRAVAPILTSRTDAAERRKQIIQESKFLGGDMKHTHLVKGLDYALLEKVKSEIQHQEQEQDKKQDQELERLANKSKEKTTKEVQNKNEEEPKFKTRMGKAIYEIVSSMKSRHIKRSEMFVPGRMAYVINLDDDAESDIPTTIIRSISDVPSYELSKNLSNDDAIINKVSQIFFNLRQTNRKENKKTKRGLPESRENEKTEEKEGKKAKRSTRDDSIYGDIGDYVPTPSRKPSSFDHGNHSYFDKQEAPLDNSAPTFKVNKASQRFKKLAQQPEAYAECYPGFQEMNDASDDSDEEVDYSKMDSGKKKRPISRWDFDTVEEYSDYMSQKEALPKAAFQFGLKMTNGRKSRKYKDKAQLVREWQKKHTFI